MSAKNGFCPTGGGVRELTNMSETNRVFYAFPKGTAMSVVNRFIIFQPLNNHTEVCIKTYIVLTFSALHNTNMQWGQNYFSYILKKGVI